MSFFSHPVRPPGATRPHVLSRLDNSVIWWLGHVSRVWPFVVFAVVLALTWRALDQIHPRQFAIALRGLDGPWLWLAGVLTAANVGAMGLYDVIAFRHTRNLTGRNAGGMARCVLRGATSSRSVRWLDQPCDSGCTATVEQISELHTGVVSVALAFSAGLIGWTAAVFVVAHTGGTLVAVVVEALAFALATTWVGGRLAQRIDRLDFSAGASQGSYAGTCMIGWLDWLLAGGTFIACLKAAGVNAPLTQLATSFFFGQALGVVSLVPGGFGSSDAFWIAHLPIENSIAAAVLLAYRIILLHRAVGNRVTPAAGVDHARRHVMSKSAKRIVAGLVGGSGVLIMLSSASPALYRAITAARTVRPAAARRSGARCGALAGLLLLVLARGLARGYRAALRVTLILLGVALAVRSSRAWTGKKSWSSAESPSPPGRNRRCSTAPAVATVARRARPRHRLLRARPLSSCRNSGAPRAHGDLRPADEHRLPAPRLRALYGPLHH